MPRKDPQKKKGANIFDIFDILDDGFEIFSYKPTAKKVINIRRKK